jgi:hypothetical protein
MLIQRPVIALFLKAGAATATILRRSHRRCSLRACIDGIKDIRTAHRRGPQYDFRRRGHRHRRNHRRGGDHHRSGRPFHHPDRHHLHGQCGPDAHLHAMTSLLLGMGMPTTANYIIMATLTAPVIIQLGSDAGLVFPVDRRAPVRLLLRHSRRRYPAGRVGGLRRGGHRPLGTDPHRDPGLSFTICGRRSCRSSFFSTMNC